MARKAPPAIKDDVVGCDHVVPQLQPLRAALVNRIVVDSVRTGWVHVLNQNTYGVVSVGNIIAHDITASSPDVDTGAYVDHANLTRRRAVKVRTDRLVRGVVFDDRIVEVVLGPVSSDAESQIDTAAMMNDVTSNDVVSTRHIDTVAFGNASNTNMVNVVIQQLKIVIPFAHHDRRSSNVMDMIVANDDVVRVTVGVSAEPAENADRDGTPFRRWHL